MSDTYIPKDHEIRASAIIHRAPLIHRQMLGRTLMDAEKIATAEWEAWIAAHDAQVAADALNAAADELDHADDLGQFKNPTEDAPLGWTDESIEAALMSSGVITDWLRARATRLQEGHDG